ncbi:FecR domain-containing protein [Chitinimonas sp. PSY-7]|uniref:FecR domain-containing protein n=1 Tax=Chitinimonas sp. PSY-7 TaxID=3459088 RepID=UPI00404015A9
MPSRLLSAVLAGLLSLSALATPTSVSAVNMPAWLERDGQKKPLLPGMTLQSEDIIHTGRGARVLLKLPEGSQVKLGEEAVFRMDNLNLSDGRTTPFTGVLNVLKGAFRFTTGLLGKPRKREVDVRIATITAGIRGTDIWGKADAEKDVICLLEGSTSVRRDGESAVHTLDQPLDFFIAPKGKPSLPVAKVDAVKLQNEWQPQTEPQQGKGLASAEGKWRLVIANVANQDEALDWYDTLQDAGFAAKIRPLAGNRYRVSIEQLATEADAHALGEQLKTEFSAPSISVMPMGS